MSPEEFEDRLKNWAQRQTDIAALVLGGSRSVRNGPAVDKWSDWDFQIISSTPTRYFGTDWLEQIAPCWCGHSERTPRGVIKVSAIFEDGLEADFVPLPAWQMKLVYWAMRRPRYAGLMPKKLVRGIQETRGFMDSGSLLFVGDESWNERFEALKIDWPTAEMTETVFRNHVTAFWQKAVWVFKKIARPEPRSAMHWLHLLVINHVYPLLAEEARLQGKIARGEARKAEKWLAEDRLKLTSIITSTQQTELLRALESQLTLFEDVSLKVAALRHFIAPDQTKLAVWLRAELTKIPF